jgi:hypothetical protein
MSSNRIFMHTRAGPSSAKNRSLVGRRELTRPGLGQVTAPTPAAHGTEYPFFPTPGTRLAWCTIPGTELLMPGGVGRGARV